MKPFRSSKRSFEATRLLVFKGKGFHHQNLGDVLEFFKPGDLLVVNRSATLPSSFKAKIKTSDEELELRLAAFQGLNPKELGDWMAIALGPGDWREDTDLRKLPPKILPGDELIISQNLSAIVERVISDRILKIRFESDNLLPELFAHGRPIQYSYLNEELKVWDQQTIFSTVPVSVESPSASFQLNWTLVQRLQEKEVHIAPLVHSAGISTTGDKLLDQQLPFDEFYSVPDETLSLIKKTKERGGRVVAIGTTVLRALETYYKTGKREGLSSLKVTSKSKIKSVDCLLTGMHEPHTSHMKIMVSLCPLGLLNEGYNQAIDLGYEGHEYGDLSLLDCGTGPSSELFDNEIENPVDSTERRRSLFGIDD